MNYSNFVSDLKEISYLKKISITKFSLIILLTLQLLIFRNNVDLVVGVLFEEIILFIFIEYYHYYYSNKDKFNFKLFFTIFLYVLIIQNIYNIFFVNNNPSNSSILLIIIKVLFLGYDFLICVGLYVTQLHIKKYNKYIFYFLLCNIINRINLYFVDVIYLFKLVNILLISLVIYYFYSYFINELYFFLNGNIAKNEVIIKKLKAKILYNDNIKQILFFKIRNISKSKCILDLRLSIKENTNIFDIKSKIDDLLKGHFYKANIDIELIN